MKKWAVEYIVGAEKFMQIVKADSKLDATAIVATQHEHIIITDAVRETLTILNEAIVVHGDFNLTEKELYRWLTNENTEVSLMTFEISKDGNLHMGWYDTELSEAIKLAELFLEHFDN